MKIKNRLSFNFTLLSAALTLLVMTAVYFIFNKHTKNDFFAALKQRAEIAAGLYLEADEISDSLLTNIKVKYLKSLPEEVIRLYDSTNTSSFVKDSNHYFTDEVINTVRRKRYFQYDDREKQVVGIYYEDNQGNFVILVSASNITGKEQLSALLRILAFLFLFEVIILFIAGRWFAQKIVSPIQKINERVKQISATDLQFRVDEGKSKDELGELAGNFNNLLQRLQDAFEMQKTFVSNASHELRTPLTNIIGEIEVAISQERSPSEYNQVLHSVLNESEKLNEIIQGLLDLAKAENSIGSYKTEPVRIDELLWEIQYSFKQATPAKVLQIEMPSLPEDANKLCITANKQLLNSAISNIILNGFKFSDDQPVTCLLKQENGFLVISISDTGIGINKEDMKKIFQAFYRSNESYSFDGHGMGLFIAQKIIHAYGGAVSVNSEKNKGSCFNVFFAINP